VRPVLHAWQVLAVRRLIEALRAHHRVVGVAPTGSGKTVIGAALVRDTLAGAQVLWLAHRIELIEQAREQLIAAGLNPREVGILSGTKTENEGARILVSSVQMFGRGRPIPPCDLVVIDEAHRAASDTYRRIIEQSQDRYVLGLTATPWRLDGQPLGDVFAHLEVLSGVTELEKAGTIAAPVTYGIPKKRAREIVKGASSGKDYDVSKVAAAMSTKVLIGDVVSECARLAPGQRTIVFAVNREHGRTLHRAFVASGRRADYLDGETPQARRKEILKHLEAGKTEVVVNVDVVSEGFDCPAVKCISIARPTKSLTRFLQYCGRGVRTYEGQRPVILDHGGNVWRHGMPNADRAHLWTLDGDAKGDGEAPVRRCEACGAMVQAWLSECPECGATLKTEEELKHELVELERLNFGKAERTRKRGVLEQIAASRGKKGEEAKRWVEAALAEVC
jgi:DNA repair protein RadD